MLYFNKTQITEATENTPKEKILNFDQLEGMIEEGQWIELIREFIQCNCINVSDILKDVTTQEEFNLRIPDTLKKDYPNKESLEKFLSNNSEMYLQRYCNNNGYVEKNWEYFCRKYYESGNSMLDGMIMYMMTFSDGDVSVKCPGYY